jgi:hypothetical protein
MGDSMNCPKCGFGADNAPECPACGVIFARLRVTPISEPAAPEPASRSPEGVIAVSRGDKLLWAALVAAIVLAACAVLGNTFALSPAIVITMTVLIMSIPLIVRFLNRTFLGSRSARTKKVLMGAAATCLAIGVVAYASWIFVLRIGPGERGEYWTAWDTAIRVIWVVIPVVLVVSFLAAVASAFVKPRSGPAHVAAITVIVIATVVVTWIVFVVTHLRIS